MEQFNFLLPFFLIGLGVAFVGFSILVNDDKSYLKSKGILVKGIVFKQATNSAVKSFDDAPSLKDKVTIRFVTKKQEWITGDIEQNFQIFYPNQYRDGEEVSVYYDDTEPTKFYVDSKQSVTKGRLLFACLGILFIIVGAYKYLI